MTVGEGWNVDEPLNRMLSPQLSGPVATLLLILHQPVAAAFRIFFKNFFLID